MLPSGDDGRIRLSLGPSFGAYVCKVEWAQILGGSQPGTC